MKLIPSFVAQAVAGVSALLATGFVMAQDASPLLTAATTATGSTKTELLTVAGLLFVVTLALWGAYKIIRMFGSR